MTVATLPPSSKETEAVSAQADDRSDCRDELPDRADAFRGPKAAGLIILALLPFWMIPISHVVSNPDTATGFFHYELPYYVANGRAAFERGNGVLYPNPYNPAADAPSIYAHWLPWTFGLLTAKFGFDPGDVVLTFTFFASLAFAVATRQLVAVRTHSTRDRNIAFLGAMLGGGLLCIAGLVVGATAAHMDTNTTMSQVLAFDPGNGMWFLNWGRNALFPTEAIYHAIVAMCWIAEIRGHSRRANLWMLLLATTHPWSGLELLLTVNLWRSICYVRERTTIRRNQLSISVVMLVAFLGYYKGWLPTFPSHAELQHVWELAWRLNWSSAFLAYLPVLIPCAVFLKKKLPERSLQRSEQFLLCALAVAVGLAFHDRIISPVQPLHFTRGYVWMPMFLLGVPVVLEWWKAARRRSKFGAIAVAGLLALLAIDNIVFSVVHSHRQLTQQDGFHLDSDERALFASIHQSRAASTVVLTDSKTLNYLLPTYANARPWLGHQFNTPHFPDRENQWRRCFPDESVQLMAVPDDVNTLVIRRDKNGTPLEAGADWQPLPLRNAKWCVWTRTP